MPGRASVSTPMRSCPRWDTKRTASRSSVRATLSAEMPSNLLPSGQVGPSRRGEQVSDIGDQTDSAAIDRATETTNDRFLRGAATLEKLGSGRSSSAAASWGDIAPDFARMTVEFAFGDIASRPGLDPKTREVAIIAALTVLGRPAILKQHIAIGLQVGLTREEIVEIFMQMAVHGGWPAAVDALTLAREFFIDPSAQS